MKRKDWTGGLFFIYLAFVIWVILDVYKRQALMSTDWVKVTKQDNIPFRI